MSWLGWVGLWWERTDLDALASWELVVDAFC